jgi:hypothetical protein
MTIRLLVLASILMASTAVAGTFDVTVIPRGPRAALPGTLLPRSLPPAILRA